MEVSGAVVHARADLSRGEELEHVISVDTRARVDRHLVEVPRMPRLQLRWRRGRDQELGEQLVVGLPELGSLVDPVVESQELMAAEGSLQIRHVAQWFPDASFVHVVRDPMQISSRFVDTRRSSWAVTPSCTTLLWACAFSVDAIQVTVV
jgi:hypothetical protein